MKLRKIKIIKNRRGDVPVTILVLGVFVICTLAVISFINSDKKVEKAFSIIKMVEEANSNLEEYNLNHYYDEETQRRIVPKLKGKWVEERIIFSVEYNPRAGGNP